MACWTAEIEYRDGTVSTSPEFARRLEAAAWQQGQLSDSAAAWGRLRKNGRPASAWMGRRGYVWRFIRAELLFGGTWLRITDGLTDTEKVYQYRDLGTHVELTTAAGEVYVCSTAHCTCDAEKYRHGFEACRHRSALRELALERRQAEGKVTA